LDASGVHYKFEQSQRKIYSESKFFKVVIDLSKDYPFFPPKIYLQPKSEFNETFSLFDFERLKFEDIMKEHWHPSIKIQDVIEKSIDFSDKNACPISEI
jgi:ubiquitin-protein ligase